MQKKDRASPEKEQKAPANDMVNQMIRENARRLLLEQKKRRQLEMSQKQQELEKKGKILEDSQRVRLHNKKFFYNHKKNKKSIQREAPAWGVDQRKLSDMPRKSLNESTMHKKEKYYKLEEHERRERLGLGHMDDETFERLRKRSKAKYEVNHERPDSSGERADDRRRLSKEEEDQIKAFMHEKRMKLEEEMNRKKSMEREKKKKIKENLDRVREDARVNLHMPKASHDMKNQNKSSRKHKKGNFSEDFGRWNEQSDYPFNPEVERGLEYEDNQYYDNLYGEFKKIINGKIIQSTKSRGEESLRSPGDYTTSERNSLRAAHNESGQKSMNGYRVSADPENSGFRSSANSFETQQRKEIAKKKMAELSKRYENVLHGVEGQLMNEMRQLEQQQLREQKQQMRHQMPQQTKNQRPPRDKNYDKPRQQPPNPKKNLNGHQYQQPRSQKGKAMVPSIRMPNREKIEMGREEIEELDTSNFSDENRLRDESFVIPEHEEPDEESPKKDDQDESDYEDPRAKGLRDGYQNHPHAGGAQRQYYQQQPEQNHKHGPRGQPYASSDHYGEYSEDRSHEGSELQELQEASYDQNLEILEAAAIFIQKNFRGYRTRKAIREYLMGIDEAGYEGQLDELPDLREGQYYEYPYEDEEGRRIIIGPNKKAWLIDQDGNILGAVEGFEGLEGLEDGEGPEEYPLEGESGYQQKDIGRRSRSFDELRNSYDSQGHELDDDSHLAGKKDHVGNKKPEHRPSNQPFKDADHGQEGDDSDFEEGMFNPYEELNRKLAEEQKKKKELEKQKLQQKQNNQAKTGKDNHHQYLSSDEEAKDDQMELKAEPAAQKPDKPKLKLGNISAEHNKDFEDKKAPEKKAGGTGISEEQKKLQDEVWRRLTEQMAMSGRKEVSLDGQEDNIDTNEFLTEEIGSEAYLKEKQEYGVKHEGKLHPEEHKLLRHSENLAHMQLPATEDQTPQPKPADGKKTLSIPSEFEPDLKATLAEPKIAAGGENKTAKIQLPDTSSQDAQANANKMKDAAVQIENQEESKKHPSGSSEQSKGTIIQRPEKKAVPTITVSESSNATSSKELVSEGIQVQISPKDERNLKKAAEASSTYQTVYFVLEFQQFLILLKRS